MRFTVTWKTKTIWVGPLRCSRHSWRQMAVACGESPQIPRRVTWCDHVWISLISRPQNPSLNLPLQKMFQRKHYLNVYIISHPNLHIITPSLHLRHAGFASSFLLKSGNSVVTVQPWTDGLISATSSDGWYHPPHWGLHSSWFLAQGLPQCMTRCHLQCNRKFPS